MSRRVVICLDGTGNEADTRRPTSVGVLWNLLDLSDPSEQIAYYDPGVGTLPSEDSRGPVKEQISRLWGLAFGAGLRKNLVEAYTFLMRNWQPGDEIYIFGFSRGAYTARALAGILTKPGLLRPELENLIDYAMRRYAANLSDTEACEDLERFGTMFCRDMSAEQHFGKVESHRPEHVSAQSLPIAYLGLWDTVKAAGLLTFGNLHWPFTCSLPNTYRIRHAVAIDERRRPYRPYCISRTDERAEEVWFTGVHSEVGGTFLDGNTRGRIAFDWVIEGAESALALQRPEPYADKVGGLRPQTNDASERPRKMCKAWWLLLPRFRRIPNGADIHASTRNFYDNYPDLRPPLPTACSWVDEGWDTRRPR